MGSSASSTRHRRVTFNRDDDGRIINEYRDAPYSRGQPSTVTTIERTFTDQDSFELGDPRTTRSRESTFSLGQHIKKRAEIDERRVDKIIEDHHHIIPSSRRAASPDRVVVTKTTTIVDGSTSSDGRLDISRPRTSLGERVPKPTMTEQLWTSGGGRESQSYLERRDVWTPRNADGTRLELSTSPGRSSTLRTNNGVAVLSGEVLHASHLSTGDDDVDRRRYRVARHRHRDTADHLPSMRHYRVRKSGGSSIASSTSSMFSGVTVSDPGSGHPRTRYSRHHFIDDRSPSRRHHRDGDYDFDRDAVLHRHRLPREPPEPEVVTVTRHVRRLPRDGRVIYDERSGDEDDHDSGYRGSPKHVDESPMFRRSPILRRHGTPPERGYVTTRHVYE